MRRFSSLAAVGALAAFAAAPASASTLVLHAGDTFTAGHSGVVCQVGTGGDVSCMNTTARVSGMTSAKARAVCGATALQGITVAASKWSWACGTGVSVLPSAKSNGWAVSHHLAVDPRTRAAVVPNNWSFTTGAVNCHVASNGSLGCASVKNNANGFVADGAWLYARGV